MYDFQAQWECPCGSRDFITDMMRPGLLCTACGLETVPDVLEAMAKDRDGAKLKAELDKAMDTIGDNMNEELKRREAKLAGSLMLDQPSDAFGSMAEGAGVAWDVCGEQPSRVVYDAAYDREGLEPLALPASVPPEPAGEFRQGMHTHLPTDAQARKDQPMARGLLDYFPQALAYVAHVSKVGNDQHNPGQPMHWARGKSTDHADCIIRHLVDRGTVDKDGLSHTGKVAWRALALLQEEIEDLSR